MKDFAKCKTLFTIKSNIHMNAEITKGTEEKNLSDGLQELAIQIKPSDITMLAALESVDPTTIRRYLKGNVPIPALGRSILANGRKILLKRNAA